MEQRNKRVIIWSTSVIDLMEDKAIGGIAVQMYFWAQIFADQGWEVYSFSERHNERMVKEGITFLPKKNIKRINLLSEWWHAFLFTIKLRPEIIIYRGANRELLPLTQMSKLFGVKLLFFAASDVNFEPGKELVGSKLNRKCYQRAVKSCKYFIVQNTHQQETLRHNYGKDSTILYNIWGTVRQSSAEDVPQSDAVWVANFRTLKRAEWVIDTAESKPEYRFILAGGPMGDGKYYEEIKKHSDTMDNIDFLGPRSFFYTCELVSMSRVLLCTSTFEGFPNTFLQAWSHGLPIISTVDPSGIISKYKLGETVNTEEELATSLQRILNNREYYRQLQRNVNIFFHENLSSLSGYNKLIQYIISITNDNQHIDNR